MRVFMGILALTVALWGLVGGQTDDSECFGDVDQLINECPQLTELENLRQVLLLRSPGTDEDPAFSLGCCTALSQLNDARCFCNQELIDVFTEATGEEEFLPSLLFQASQLTPAGCAIPVYATLGTNQCEPFGNTKFPQELVAEETCTDDSMSDVIMSERKLVFLQEALDLLELGPQIDAESSLTIFAPSDDAFELWTTRQELTVTDLLSSETELTSLIQKHIIPNFVASADTVDEAGVTKISQDGTNLQLQLDANGALLVQGVPAQQPAKTACNGVLYIIDQVLDGTEVPPVRAVVAPTQADNTPEVEVEPETVPAPEIESNQIDTMPQFLPASVRSEPVSVEVMQEPEVEVTVEPIPTPTPTPTPAPVTAPAPVPTPTPVPAPVAIPDIVPVVFTPPTREIVPSTVEEEATAENVTSSLSESDGVSGVVSDPTAPVTTVAAGAATVACEDNIFNIMSRFLPLFQEYLNIASSSDLKQFLETEQAITVLAPINTALLSKSEEELANWDPYNHVIMGSLTLEDLEQFAGSTIQTVNGEVEASIGADGKLQIGGVDFIQSDVQGCNGQLHVLGDLIYNDQIIDGGNFGGAFEADGLVTNVPTEPVAIPAPEPSPSPSPIPSPSPEPVPIPSPEPSPSPSPEPVPIPSPEPVLIPSPEPSPSPLPSPRPKPSPEIMVAPSPEVSPSPIPTPTPTPKPVQIPLPVPLVSSPETVLEDPTSPLGVAGQSPCSCSESGVSGGIDTGRPGCAIHVPDWPSFCYVIEPKECSLARPSGRYPGARYRNCTIGGDNNEIEEAAEVATVRVSIDSNACACTQSGLSGGVQTKRIGCKNHIPGNDKFCYVVNPNKCEIDIPSNKFEGAGYRACSISTDVVVTQQEATFQQIMNEETGESSVEIQWQGQSS